MKCIEYVEYQGTLHLRMILRGWKETECIISVEGKWLIRLEMEYA